MFFGDLETLPVCRNFDGVMLTGDTFTPDGLNAKKERRE